MTHDDDAPFRDDAACERILDGVLARDLPKAEWTHHAHCVYAAALLMHLTLAEAEEAAPRHIRLYNERCGVQNTASSGYHHGLTLLYLRSIADALAGQTGPISDRVALILASPISEKRFPLSIYAEDALFTPSARLFGLANQGA